MRRALLACAAAAVGAGVVIGVAPRSGGPTAAATNPAALPSQSSPSTSTHHHKATAKPKATKTASPAPTEHSSAPKSSAPSKSASQPASQPVSKTVTGPEVSNGWGPFQVSVTVKDGKITAVDVPVIPQDGRSQFINSRAVPILAQEAVQANSAKVDVVSGATDSSYAFMQSLSAALQQIR